MGKPGEPVLSTATRRLGRMVAEERGIELAKTAIEQTTRRSLQDDPAMPQIRYATLLDVLEEVGVATIRGQSITAIRIRGGQPPPVAARDRIADPDLVPDW